MKRIVSMLLIGGTVVAASFVTAAPASAAAKCYDYPSEVLVGPGGPIVCIGYDYCDAPVCIDWPPTPE